MNIQRAIDWNTSFGNKKGLINPKLELSMIREEVGELEKAMKDHDVVETIDAIIDTMFVLVGTAHKLGMDADSIKGAREEVCDSNFTKLPVKKDDDGKIIKSKNFRAPDLHQFAPYVPSIHAGIEDSQ